jgi:RNA polymerase sigma-70 factor, ECF subfamily
LNPSFFISVAVFGENLHFSEGISAAKTVEVMVEQDLIEQARHDPEAFRQLYRAYFPRIYAYIAYRVGQESDAEDLTADVFVKVVETLDRFEYRGDGAFAAWLFKIAYHRVAQFYRQQTPTLVSFDQLPDIRSDSPTPDSVLMQKEQFMRLRDRIQTLSPRRQEIVTLRFFSGLRNQEIAAVLGLDERTIAAHLSRAIEDLQKRYETDGKSP